MNSFSDKYNIAFRIAFLWFVIMIFGFDQQYLLVGVQAGKVDLGRVETEQ